MSSPAIRNARSKPASTLDISRGLLAYASFDYGELRLEAIVRRSAGGRIYLAFPANIVGGRRLPHVEPLDQAARARIEREVLEQLGFAARRRA